MARHEHIINKHSSAIITSSLVVVSCCTDKQTGVRRKDNEGKMVKGEEKKRANVLATAWSKTKNIFCHCQLSMQFGHTQFYQQHNSFLLGSLNLSCVLGRHTTQGHPTGVPKLFAYFGTMSTSKFQINFFAQSFLGMVRDACICVCVTAFVGICVLS